MNFEYKCIKQLKILPDPRLGRSITYFHHQKIIPLVQEFYIVRVDIVYKHVREHQTCLDQHWAVISMVFQTFYQVTNLGEKFTKVELRNLSNPN